MPMSIDNLPVQGNQADSALVREIADLVVSALNLDITADQIDPSAPLYGEGLGLDSIDILEVALVASKRYGFKLKDEDRDNIPYRGPVVHSSGRMDMPEDMEGWCYPFDSREEEEISDMFPPWDEIQDPLRWSMSDQDIRPLRDPIPMVMGGGELEGPVEESGSPWRAPDLQPLYLHPTLLEVVDLRIIGEEGLSSEDWILLEEPIMIPSDYHLMFEG